MTLSYDEWTNALHEGDLLGLACTDCNATYGTPISVCHDCGSRDLESIELPTEGELHSVTRINVAPVGFDGPYYVGLVELDDVRLTARIESDGDSESKSKSELTVGTTVTFTGVIEADRDGYPAPVFTG